MLILFECASSPVACSSCFVSIRSSFLSIALSFLSISSGVPATWATGIGSVCCSSFLIRVSWLLNSSRVGWFMLCFHPLVCFFSLMHRPASFHTTWLYDIVVNLLFLVEL